MSGILQSIARWAQNIVYSLDPTLIAADTADTADNKRIIICGGGTNAPTRGAYIYVSGNESAGNGAANIVGGDTATSHIGITTNNAAAEVQIKPDNSGTISFITGMVFKSTDGANETTGAATCTLGTTSPATVTTPYKWIKVVLSDASVGYIPVWK